MSAVPCPDLLEQLRQATREDHHALDRHPQLQRLLRPGLTREGYAAVLLTLHGPQACLERAVTDSAARLGLSDGLSPTRLPDLQADLRALGIDRPPAAPELPLLSASTPAALLGLRYVLEGSRLGGELLARQIRLQLGDTAPLAFFAAPAGRQHWQCFIEQVRQLPVDAEARQQAMRSARQAFALFREACTLSG